MITTAASTKGPSIDWAAFSPILSLACGAVIVLLVGLLPGRAVRERIVPGLTMVTLAVALGLTIWQWGENTSIVSGALAVDDLSLVLNLVFVASGMAAVVLSLRERATVQAGQGEYYTLLLASLSGMAVLVAAQNLVTLFVGIELLSIPLYVLCASELQREKSLESGLKYLIIGSVGSATLLYGLALIYGATGSTDFAGIAAALGRRGETIAGDPLMLTGIGLAIVGFGFKAAVAPFHQWTPDVYEGAPTPVTAFMSIATKAAAFGVFLRFMDVAVIDEALVWQPIVAALAATTIIVGNVGALAQTSVKRILAWSSVAQGGYLLVGIVVSSATGMEATLYYLIVYAFMNLAAFSVVVARERETAHGDSLHAFAGLGATRPVLAWPMTIAMLALAGIPATAGFVGKLNLIGASVDGNYAWLGVLIAIGSAISLAYYLRIIAVMWMPERAAAMLPVAPAVAGRPAIAGGSAEADQPRAQPEVIALAIIFSVATIFFGIIPSPIFDLVKGAGQSLGLL